jgi:hypothetical protein
MRCKLIVGGLAACVSVAVLFGCGEARHEQTVGQCVVGWWVEAESSTCSSCDATNKNPECSHRDCVQLSFEGFRTPDAVIDGVVTYSEEAGTVSSVGLAEARTYRVIDNKVQIASTKGEGLTCSDAKLSTTYYHKVRASPQVATGFERALAAGPTAFKAVSTR